MYMGFNNSEASVNRTIHICRKEKGIIISHLAEKILVQDRNTREIQDPQKTGWCLLVMSQGKEK